MLQRKEGFLDSKNDQELIRERKERKHKNNGSWENCQTTKATAAVLTDHIE